MYVSISVYCSCICTVSSIIYASVTFARCDLDYLKFLARKLLLVLQHRIFVSCFFFSVFLDLLFSFLGQRKFTLANLIVAIFCRGN